MSTCEKCWADAYRLELAGKGNQPRIYERLLRERKDHPCTPEEQAGPDAQICLNCKRKTLHQITGQCMNPECKKESSQSDRFKHEPNAEPRRKQAKHDADHHLL